MFEIQIYKIYFVENWWRIDDDNTFKFGSIPKLKLFETS
jgi:hypothetical protein